MLPRLFAIILVLSPAPALAEALGQITIFLDGEERVWHTISVRKNTRKLTTATLMRKPHRTELQLQGHPVPAFTSKDVFSIDVGYAGQYAPGAEPSSIEILYTPNGLSGPIWTSRGAPNAPRLQIVEFKVWGSVGQFIGVITGEVCERPRLFSRTNTANCKPLNGKIETRFEAS